MVTYPAFSHNAIGLEESAISQICDVRLLTGEAEVVMRFQQDEYSALSGGTLVNINFPNGPKVYQKFDNPNQKPSSDLYFDEIAQALVETKRKQKDLIDWVSVAFNDMLDDVPNV